MYGYVRRLALALAIGIGGTACASTTGGTGDPAVDRLVRESGKAHVVVTNNNWADMNIYALVAGTKHRLGTVTSMTSQRFSLHPSLMLSSSDLRLIADPIGGSNVFASQPIMVGPGQRVSWNLENNLVLSSFSVR